MSASDFVRSMPPSMPAKEVVAAANQKGIKLSQSLVYMVRGKARRRGAAAQGRPRRGRPPKVAAAPAPAPSSDVAAFKALALKLGLARARAALDELERGLAALLR